MLDERLLRQLESDVDSLRKRDKDSDSRKTYDQVFDRAALLNLAKLISDGAISTLDYPVSTGKEANVFHATDREGRAKAVKIYRINTATFRNIAQYIEGDSRFRGVRRATKPTILAWALKEYKNLLRMHEAGVTVPSPVAHLENVLVMEYLFVGDGHEPAPSLKGARGFDAPAVYEALRKDVRRMVAKARLVHGDLSEYNVLLAEGRPHIIDVGQAVVLDHPRAKEFLRRDAENVARFFGRLKVGEGAADLYEFWSHGVSFERRRGRGRAGGEEE